MENFKGSGQHRFQKKGGHAAIASMYGSRPPPAEDFEPAAAAGRAKLVGSGEARCRNSPNYPHDSPPPPPGE